MRFQGSNITTAEGKSLIRIRNSPRVFLVVDQNLLDILGDLRYVSLFIDHTDQVWARKPAGKQKALAKPYRLAAIAPKNVLDIWDVVA